MAAYQHGFLIYNPHAGKLRRRGAEPVQAALAQLRSEGHQVQAMPTRGPLTAGLIARECIGQGADLVIACGGDGTINEVANGMVGSRVPLAVLPGGTANVMSVELGLGTDPLRAARTIGTAQPRRIAVGELLHRGQHTRYFLLMAGVGLDAHIVYHLRPGMKHALGKLSYWVGGFSQLTRKLDELDVTTEGATVRCSFALASRVRNYGGDLSIARHVSLLEDQFELVLFEGSYAMRYLSYMGGILLGKLEKQPGITVRKTREADFHAPGEPSIYVQVDGEYAGRLPAAVRIVPDALTMLIPAEYLRG